MRKTALICALVSGALGIPTAAVLARAGSTAQSADPLAELTGQAASRLDGAAADRHGKSGKGGKGGKGKGKHAKNLITGFDDPYFTKDNPDDPYFTNGNPAARQQALDQAVQANGSVVRLVVSWSQVAPTTLSAGFDPRDPASPQYNWRSIDAAVRDAKARNLRPMLLVI